jgi:diaminohydroxyphosphoribosylaminopyrimidine deaminase/5-amino-6-(5-phosphoribosylamino)uracil reductase
VVIACEDPDPRVSGRGIARLRAAGIDVVVGEQRAAAEDVNAGFFQRVRSGRPLVTWKTATSLDGRIATAAGHARWITGDAARAHAHLERSRHDAILVGIGTALADDPQLTCRLPGMAHRSPVRVVLDSNLRLPATARLAAEAATVPTWLIARDDVADDRSRELRARGVEIIRVPADDGSRPDTVRVLQELAARGVTRLLVEGGAEVAASLIRRSLVDRIDWYRAPMLIGGAGRAATRPFGLARLDAAPRFTRTGLRKLGDDWLETYRRLD